MTELRAVTPTGGAVTRVTVPIPPAVHDEDARLAVELRATYHFLMLETLSHVQALHELLV